MEKRTAPKIWIDHLDGSHRWNSWMEITDGETNNPSERRGCYYYYDIYYYDSYYYYVHDKTIV